MYLTKSGEKAAVLYRRTDGAEYPWVGHILGMSCACCWSDKGECYVDDFSIKTDFASVSAMGWVYLVRSMSSGQVYLSATEPVGDYHEMLGKRRVMVSEGDGL